MDIPDPGQQPLQAEDPPPDDQPLDIPLADVPEDEPEESQTSQVDPVQGIPAPDLDATLPFAEGDDQSQDAADSDDFIMNLDNLGLTQLFGDVTHVHANIPQPFKQNCIESDGQGSSGSGRKRKRRPPAYLSDYCT